MDIIKEHYYNPKIGFKSQTQTYQDLKDKGITKEQVKEFFKNQETTQVFKKVEEAKFIPITAGGDEEYQLDLMFYDQFEKQNNGYHIIMTMIELTSRFAYAVALKNKTSKATAEAMKSIIKENKNIKVITTDNGSEFESEFRKLLKENNITQVTVIPSENKHTTGKVERFNRTLRMRIDKYMKANKTKKWVDVLDDLIYNYNNTVHSVTKLKPSEVKEKDSAVIRLEEKMRSKPALDELNKFKVGDHVRTIKKAKTFKKGSANYSTAIYEIVRLDGFGFYLKNIKTNDELKTKYKYYELQKIQNVEKLETDKQQDSGKQIKIDNKFKRLQSKEFKPGHEVEKIEDGEVIFKDRLKPANEKRIRKPVNRL